MYSMGLFHTNLRAILCDSTNTTSKPMKTQFLNKLNDVKLLSIIYSIHEIFAFYFLLNFVFRYCGCSAKFLSGHFQFPII